MLSDAECVMIEGEMERIDDRLVKRSVRNEVLMELAARVLGMYLVGGRRFGVPDTNMVVTVVSRAKAFADTLVSAIHDET